jgi:hypothetical protein
VQAGYGLHVLGDAPVIWTTLPGPLTAGRSRSTRLTRKERRGSSPGTSIRIDGPVKGCEWESR